MVTQGVSMRFARAPDGAVRRSRVRELTGADEMAVDGAGTASALALLGRVADVEGGGVDALTASDRDRLLAAVYRATFGDRVQSSPTCAGCGKPFDVAFSLSALVRDLDAGAQADDALRLSDGRPLHVPDARDEMAAGDLPCADGVTALATAAGVAADGPVGEAAFVLQRDAPIVDVDLAVTCPECESAQSVAFDLQSFLLLRILAERRRLTAEVHTLASTYGWSLQEILAMPRRRRRAFIATIDDAQRRAAGMIPWSA